jgi:hypothetical protein
LLPIGSQDGQEQMKTIRIIKRNEREPASIESGATLEQVKSAYHRDQREMIKTVLSWVSERRESAQQALGRLPITVPVVDPNSTGRYGPQ